MPALVNRILSRAWWLVCPAFAALVMRLTFERACADPYNLLPQVMSRPMLAMPVALLYVSAHVWVVAVYLQAATAAGTLWPLRNGSEAILWRERWKAIALVALLAIEYAPVSLWRLFGCR